jgi:hypothetical protein
MRASDADRDRYAAVLQEAYAEGRLTREEYDERLDACMRAKTYGELEPLVRDLPAKNLPVVRPAADLVPTSASNPPMIAVFSAVERKGAWVIPADSTAVAVFGQVSLDLRQATHESSTTEIKAYAVFGGVDILVQPGTIVECAGIGVFGDFSRTGKVAEPRPDSPVVRLSGLALFGAVSIKEKRLK